MKKIIANIRTHFKAYLITFFVSIALGLGIFLTFYFVHYTKIIGAIDGTGVAAIVLAGVAGLMWVGRLGAYDSMSYGFKQMFSSMFGKSANKYNDFASYKEEKYSQRKTGAKLYFVMLLVALLFLIAFIILEVVKGNVLPR